jgi:putative ABC transport system permease protein
LTALLDRASARYWQRHPLLTALSLLGIALGVAVVVAIAVANDSALRAFDLSRRTVAGRATHQIVGGPTGIPDELFVRIRRDLDLAAAPIVEGYASTPRAPGRALLLLGIDPFFQAPFQRDGAALSGQSFARLLSVPDSCVLPSALASALGVRAGDALPLSIEGRTRQLIVLDTLPPDASSSDTLVCDIATAQDLLGQPGRLERIDLIVPAAEGDAVQRVREICAGTCDVVPAAAESAAASQMTRAFRLNTNALGLLALVVGMFLTYNTMTFFVVERRALFATLRAVGVTRRELFLTIVKEALRLAVPGTLLGLVAGLLLARLLLRLVTRTINDLYFVVHVGSLSLEPATLIAAAALGIGATVASALVPAWEATRVPPGITYRRSTRERALRKRAPLLAGLGAATIAGAVILVSVSARSLLAAFGALLAVLAGAALATPLAVGALGPVLAQLGALAFGLSGRIGARATVSSLGRSSVAISALMIAVATTAGVGIMVQSFRQAVSEWLTEVLKSDIFVQLPSAISRKRQGTIEPAVAARIAGCEGVAKVNTIRTRRVRTGEGEVDLHVPSYGDLRVRTHRFRAGVAADVYRALDRGAVAVSEPYAFRHRLSLGGALDLLTDRGWQAFAVAGIYADYASDEGAITMMRETYERYFDDRGISAMGLMAAPGEDLSVLRDRVRGCAGGEQALVVTVQRELKEASLAIFDRTFAVTSVLRLITVVVAFLGILSSLSALALERARELAVLRAVGMLPRQVRVVVMMHTTALGLCAGLLSLPLGWGLAFFLVHVINRRSFGWSLELSGSPALMLESMVLSLGAAILAGLYPAWKMSRTAPAAALRDE